MNDKKINISIQELVYRVSAATRSSMTHEFSDFLIGYGWQVNEDVFVSDVEGYVGLFFTDGDILDKETVEQNIEWGLGDCEEFMLDFYQVNYEGKNEKGKDEEFTAFHKDNSENGFFEYLTYKNGIYINTTKVTGSDYASVLTIIAKCKISKL